MIIWMCVCIVWTNLADRSQVSFSYASRLRCGRLWNGCVFGPFFFLCYIVSDMKQWAKWIQTFPTMHCANPLPSSAFFVYSGTTDLAELSCPLSLSSFFFLLTFWHHGKMSCNTRSVLATEISLWSMFGVLWFHRWRPFSSNQLTHSAPCTY